MFIWQMSIEGREGSVEIRRTERGAVVITNGVEIEVDRDDAREDRYGVAWNAAKVVFGRDWRGRPNATNSMIHGVLVEIERIAGC